jgi:NADPH:quinone reductase-like Zn-dependent oxidoreductase
VIGPLGHVARVLVAALPSHRRAVFFIASFNQSDMEALRQLLEARTVTPVVERRYDVDDVADALGYVGQGHAQGKIVVSL